MCCSVFRQLRSSHSICLLYLVCLLLSKVHPRILLGMLEKGEGIHHPLIAAVEVLIVPRAHAEAEAVTGKTGLIGKGDEVGVGIGQEDGVMSGTAEAKREDMVIVRRTEVVQSTKAEAQEGGIKTERMAGNEVEVRKEGNTDMVTVVIETVNHTIGTDHAVDN